MKVTDKECEEFRYLYLQHEGMELSLGEAREMLSRLLFMFERFAAWIAKEKAAGREFPLDEPPPAPGDSAPLR
jgi:hypothetical protein